MRLQPASMGLERGAGKGDDAAVARTRIIAAGLVALVAVVFGRAALFEFTTWDDGLNVYENPAYVDRTAWSVLSFWRRPYEGLYIPVTYTLWAGVVPAARLGIPDEHGIGFNPYPFHLLNIGLHALAVLVAWRILRLLVQSDWAAAAGAALFAVHPLQVEPVVWISGMRDVLAGLLALLAIWQFLLFAQARVDDRARWWRYAAASLACALAMLAKPGAVVTPLLALVPSLYLVWDRRRMVVLSVLPWLAMAVPVVAVARAAQPSAAELVSVPIGHRPLVAADALGFYVVKAVWPAGLGPDYGRTPQSVVSGEMRLMWVAAVVAAAVILAAWGLGHRPALPAVGGAVFVLALLPVLGLVPFEFQRISTVADRYAYLAMLGAATALAGVVARLRPIAGVAAVVVIGLLAAASLAQLSIWRDSFSLFDHALRINPRSWISHHNMAVEMARRGRRQEAIQHYRSAAMLAPVHCRWLSHYKLHHASIRDGDVLQAEEHWRLMLEDLPAAQLRGDVNLAKLLAEAGQVLAEAGRLDLAEATASKLLEAGALGDAAAITQLVSQRRANAATTRSGGQ